MMQIRTLISESHGWLLLSVVSIILAGWFLGRGLWLLPGLHQPQAFSVSPMSAPIADNKPAFAAQIEQTALFSALSSDRIEQANIVDSDLPLEVKGLIAGTRPPLAIMVFQGERRLVREGERLDDAVQIARIDSDSLLLINRDQLERLRFGAVDDDLFAPPDERPDQTFAGDKRLNAHQQARLLDGVRLLAVVEQDRMVGYELDAHGKSAAFFQRLGFEMGDRIQRVNGDEVAGMETLNQMLEQIAQGQTIDVAVLRDGREQQLTLTLKEDL